MTRTDDQARFFAGRAAAARIHRAVARAIRALGPSTTRVGKAQIAYARARGFAWCWTPDRWLRGDDVAPLVLSIALPRRDRSRRWKEVVEPAPGRFMHHLELRDPAEVDAFVLARLRAAYAAAAGASAASAR